MDNWSRKTVEEALRLASYALPPPIRPGEGLRPHTSGVLYPRRLAYNRSLWGRKVGGHTHAPSGGPGDASGRSAVHSAPSPAPQGAG